MLKIKSMRKKGPHLNNVQLVPKAGIPVFRSRMPQLIKWYQTLKSRFWVITLIYIFYLNFLVCIKTPFSSPTLCNVNVCLFSKIMRCLFVIIVLIRILKTNKKVNKVNRNVVKQLMTSHVIIALYVFFW